MMASRQPCARRKRIHWPRRRMPTHLKRSHSSARSREALPARPAQTTDRPADLAPRATRRGKMPSPAMRPRGEVMDVTSRLIWGYRQGDTETRRKGEKWWVRFAGFDCTGKSGALGGILGHGREAWWVRFGRLL